MNSPQSIVAKFQRLVDDAFTLSSKIWEQQKLISDLKSKEKTTPTLAKLQKAQLKLEELVKKTPQIQKVCIKLAQHDELVQLDPLNTERLVVCLWKCKLYEDLKMVLGILLDK